MKNILLAFIPVFVAVDALGLLPVFFSLTHEYTKKERVTIILQSMLTAVCVAVGFIFLGKIIFKLMGIGVGDFMVAGGIVLFCIAIIEILQPQKSARLTPQELGAVPLGTPLIAGPAVLTTSLILIDQYGLAATLASVLLNILFVGVVFVSSQFLMKVFGEAGSRVLSKITALLLAAIAIMMVRKGITQILFPAG